MAIFLDPAVRNRAVWKRGRFTSAYANRSLRPVEQGLLERYRDELSGRVLELGCGAGRITGYLVEIATEVYGVDLAPAMVAECRQRYPAGTFLVADLLDLDRFGDESFDAVVAGCNLFDIFGEPERRQALAEVRRVLRPGGLLVMSSHNRAFIPQLPRPTHISRKSVLHFGYHALHVPRRMWRHRRLRRYERSEPAYAIVSDGSHDFSLVHYYTTPQAQFEQLVQEGFEPLLCQDLEGRDVTPEDLTPHVPELHYVARRSPAPGGPQRTA